MLCDCCGGTGSILGFGAMKIACPQCHGARFVADVPLTDTEEYKSDSRDKLLRKRAPSTGDKNAS